VVVVLVIFAFQAFGQIDILTKGGPQGRTETLVYRIFTIQFDDANTAAVMSIGLFALTFVVTLAQYAMLQRRVTYAE
jgi:sn-glycerol 3-phosphate transport system permease protein